MKRFKKIFSYYRILQIEAVLAILVLIIFVAIIAKVTLGHTKAWLDIGISSQGIPLALIIIKKYFLKNEFSVKEKNGKKSELGSKILFWVKFISNIVAFIFYIILRIILSKFIISLTANQVVPSQKAPLWIIPLTEWFLVLTPFFVAVINVLVWLFYKGGFPLRREVILFVTFIPGSALLFLLLSIDATTIVGIAIAFLLSMNMYNDKLELGEKDQMVVSLKKRWFVTKTMILSFSLSYAIVVKLRAAIMKNILTALSKVDYPNKFFVLIYFFFIIFMIIFMIILVLMSFISDYLFDKPAREYKIEIEEKLQKELELKQQQESGVTQAPNPSTTSR